MKEKFPRLADIVKPEAVITNKTHEGTNLRFVTAFPNLLNSEKGVVIYTAQLAADIPGLNSVFHGPTDYVVAQGKEPVQSEDYNKEGESWTFE